MTPPTGKNINAPEFIPGVPNNSPPVANKDLEELTKKFAEMTAHLAQLQETITKPRKNAYAIDESQDRTDRRNYFRRPLDTRNWTCDFCGEKGHGVRTCKEMEKVKEERRKKQ